MMYAAWEFQKSVYTTLHADTALAALLKGGIHDVMPDNTAYPYVVIGNDTVRNNSTKSSQSIEIIASIECYSSGLGTKESKEISARIFALLHDCSLSLPSPYHLVLLTFQSERVEKLLPQDVVRTTSQYRSIIQHL